jgi:hypothetical protein
LTIQTVLSWNSAPHEPRVAAPRSARSEQRLSRVTHAALSNTSSVDGPM